VFVVSRADPDAMVREVAMWSVRVAGWSAKAAKALAPVAEAIAVPDEAFDGAALLVSVPPGGTLEAVGDALVKAGTTIRATALVGSHAIRYRIAAERR
jgi:hypothetical protein